MPCVTSSWMNFRMISPDSGVIAMNCSPMPHMPVPTFVRKVVDHAGLRRDLFFLQGDMHLDSDGIGIGLPRTKIHTVHGEIGVRPRALVPGPRGVFFPFCFRQGTPEETYRFSGPPASWPLTFFPTPRPVRAP